MRARVGCWIVCRTRSNCIKTLFLDSGRWQTWHNDDDKRKQTTSCGHAAGFEFSGNTLR